MTVIITLHGTAGLITVERGRLEVTGTAERLRAFARAIGVAERRSEQAWAAGAALPIRR